MQGHTLLNARFLDNDRTTILAEWQDDADKTLVRNQYMEAKDNNVQYKELLNHTSIDDIYEFTVNYEREYRKGYERYVLDLAQREGLIYNGELNPEFYGDLVNFIFSDWKEEEKERLFLLKLKLFQNIETIKDSENSELKKRLRKSKDVLEAIKYAIQIHEESKALLEDPEESTEDQNSSESL